MQNGPHGKICDVIPHFLRPPLMRISGGKARGVTLKVPKGDATRPATDGLRQSVFSSLGGWVEGATFVDLYAGSGAYGLEALSRGARTGVAVEKAARALACLKENLPVVARSAGFDPEVLDVAGCDVFDWSPPPGFTLDLVFIDPPYEMIEQIGPRLLARIGEWVGERDVVVVFEMPAGQFVAAPGWKEVKRIGRGGERQPSAAFFRRSS